MARRVQVTCDRCPAVGPAGSSVRQARQAAKRHGWWRFRRPRADLCPACLILRGQGR